MNFNFGNICRCSAAWVFGWIGFLLRLGCSAAEFLAIRQRWVNGQGFLGIDRRQESGDGNQETGNRNQETGNRIQESGNRVSNQDSGDKAPFGEVFDYGMV